MDGQKFPIKNAIGTEHYPSACQTVRGNEL